MKSRLRIANDFIKEVEADIKPYLDYRIAEIEESISNLNDRPEECKEILNFALEDTLKIRTNSTCIIDGYPSTSFFGGDDDYGKWMETFGHRRIEIKRVHKYGIDNTYNSDWILIREVIVNYELREYIQEELESLTSSKEKLEYQEGKTDFAKLITHPKKDDIANLIIKKYQNCDNREIACLLLAMEELDYIDFRSYQKKVHKSILPHFPNLSDKLRTLTTYISSGNRKISKEEISDKCKKLQELINKR